MALQAHQMGLMAGAYKFQAQRQPPVASNGDEMDLATAPLQHKSWLPRALLCHQVVA
jgi:hypothetical protein